MTLPSARDLKRVRKVREHLDSLGPLDAVALTDLAKTAGMSIRSLSRHFRVAFGVTITAYVSNARMESARRALARGEATIDFAAYVAGFSHTANFVRAFKHRYGFTPGSIAGKRIRRNGSD